MNQRSDMGCEMPKMITNDQFIERSLKIHGNKYDYSDTQYEGSSFKVSIKCKVHGCFQQRASDHVHRKAGCPKCAVESNSKNRRHDGNAFKTKAIVKHGSKYDYSAVEYVSSHSKIKIRCAKHGIFEQTPASHLHGRGCPSCRVEKLTETNSYNINDFLSKSKLMHGDKYDYSLVEYTNSVGTVRIICPNHGVFEQSAASHMGGKGCIFCYKNRVTTSVYTENATLVHSGKYDYSIVDYVNSKSKIKIICPQHGMFEQVAGEHVRGVGCPSCASYGFDKNSDAHLYFLISDDGVHMKVGITNNIGRRVNELRSATPFSFSIVEKIQMMGSDAAVSEKLIHSLMESSGLTGFDGATEWFKIERFKNG